MGVVSLCSNFSEVFATASHDNVRVWSMNTMQELLRVCVHNFTCSSVVFAHDGKSILTAWNDGIIRLVSRDLKGGVVIKVGVVFFQIIHSSNWSVDLRHFKRPQ